MRWTALPLLFCVLAVTPASAQNASPVTADPAADPVHPADMDFFVCRSETVR